MQANATKETHEDVQRNEHFPIHVDLMDSSANINKTLPGGIFMQHLYDPENKEKAEEAMLEEEDVVRKSSTLPKPLDGPTSMKLEKNSTA